MLYSVATLNVLDMKMKGTHIWKEAEASSVLHIPILNKKAVKEDWNSPAIPSYYYAIPVDMY